MRGEASRSIVEKSTNSNHVGSSPRNDSVPQWCKASLFCVSRSPVWYPDTPVHYALSAGFTHHFFLEPDRAIHDPQRSFLVPETESGILQVSQ